MKTWEQRHAEWEKRELQKVLKLARNRPTNRVGGINVCALARRLDVDRARLYRLSHRTGVPLR